MTQFTEFQNFLKTDFSNSFLNFSTTLEISKNKIRSNKTLPYFYRKSVQMCSTQVLQNSWYSNFPHFRETLIDTKWILTRGGKDPTWNLFSFYFISKYVIPFFEAVSCLELLYSPGFILFWGAVNLERQKVLHSIRLNRPLK